MLDFNLKITENKYQWFVDWFDNQVQEDDKTHHAEFKFANHLTHNRALKLIKFLIKKSFIFQHNW